MTTPQFGLYVKELRRSVGLGLREAAEKLDMAASYLSRIEGGKVPPPSKEILIKMATVFKVPLSQVASQAAEVAKNDAISFDPVASALYRLGMTGSANDRIEFLAKAIDQMPIPDNEKQWWRDELVKLRIQINDAPPGLHRMTQDLYDRCAIPRILSAADIATIATARLIEYFGALANIVLPIPIEDIVEDSSRKIDLAVIEPEESGSLPDGSPRVLGKSRWTELGRREVGIDERLFTAPKCSSSRRRGNFTLAHEYFHALEHLPLMQRASECLERPAVVFLEEVGVARREPKKLKTHEDWREYQANEFAAAVLMPRSCVEEQFCLRFGNQPISVSAAQIATLSRELAKWSDGVNESLADVFDVNPLSMAIRLQKLGLVTAE